VNSFFALLIRLQEAKKGEKKQNKEKSNKK
jgi:hypothetical protein